MSTRQPATLSRTAWDTVTFEQRVQAMLTALEMALDRATRFELVTDDLSLSSLKEGEGPAWAARVERVDSLASLPRAVRAGCGCLGLLFRPLVWLGIVQVGREYRLEGELTPQAAQALQRAATQHAAYRIRLWRDERPVWESWHTGDDWRIWVTGEEFDLLTQRLHPILEVDPPLEWVPERAWAKEP